MANWLGQETAMSNIEQEIANVEVNLRVSVVTSKFDIVRYSILFFRLSSSRCPGLSLPFLGR